MAIETFLVRTMSDTVETDIERVHVITNEILHVNLDTDFRAAAQGRRRSVRFIFNSAYFCCELPTTIAICSSMKPNVWKFAGSPWK